MSSGIRFRRRSLIAGLAALAGCVQLPPAPTPAPVDAPGVSAPEQIGVAIAKYQQLARQYKQADDLAAAATQFHLLTLLKPGDPGFRRELAATRAEIDRRVRENLAAGNAALRRGDLDRAADAMLGALALDPENAEAADRLREIEKRRAARTQAGRAAKAGAATNRGPDASYGSKR